MIGYLVLGGLIVVSQGVPANTLREDILKGKSITLIYPNIKFIPVQLLVE